MATSEGFKDFVLECLNEAECGGEFSFLARKMFGEYCIYVIDKGIKKCFFSCAMIVSLLGNLMRFLALLCKIVRILALAILMMERKSITLSTLKILSF